MKRALAILFSFAILYAGAASAFAGCENLIAAAAGHEHGDDSGGHHHDRDASTPEPSDSGKIHCPDLFGAFLAGPRVSLETERRVIAAVDYPVFDLSSVLQDSVSPRFNLGPPGQTVSQLRPLHLLLSVIRI
jgi:hypothetical protein